MFWIGSELLKEPELITCPNPECGRKIGELIVVSDLSTRTVKRYYGCPYCLFEVDVISANFLRKEKMRAHTKEEMTRIGEKNGKKIKSGVNAENEENDTRESEPSAPTHPSLEKILDVISAEPQEKKEESPMPEEKEEKGPSGCRHHFGYLASRPKNDSIPQECLICPKVLDCTLKMKKP